ncbi:hypothetical protein AUP68_11170 [Ilyonectria robusta]
MPEDSFYPHVIITDFAAAARETWMPLCTQWARAYTKRYHNYRHTTTSPCESIHASTKSFLRNTSQTLHQLFHALKLQKEILDEKFEEEINYEARRICDEYRYPLHINVTEKDELNPYQRIHNPKIIPRRRQPQNNALSIPQPATQSQPTRLSQPASQSASATPQGPMTPTPTRQSRRRGPNLRANNLDILSQAIRGIVRDEITRAQPAATLGQQDVMQQPVIPRGPHPGPREYPRFFPLPGSRPPVGDLLPSIETNSPRAFSQPSALEADTIVVEGYEESQPKRQRRKHRVKRGRMLSYEQRIVFE